MERATSTWDLRTSCREDRSSGSRDMLDDRQTHRQTDRDIVRSRSNNTATWFNTGDKHTWGERPLQQLRRDHIPSSSYVVSLLCKEDVLSPASEYHRRGTQTLHNIVHLCSPYPARISTDIGECLRIENEPVVIRSIVIIPCDGKLMKNHSRTKTLH